jgi:hypothetical protein
MQIPGVKGDSPLVGVDHKQLEDKRREHAERKLMLERQIASRWKCLRCKKLWWGRDVRVKLADNMEVLVCPDSKCGGPVIVHQDALSLTNPPRGGKGGGK